MKMAMEEIKAIMNKHDIAGVVQLQSPTHGEFLYALEASWSCISFEPGGRVRFKAAMQSGGGSGDVTRERERARVSAGMVLGLIDAGRKQIEDLTQLAMLIGKHVNVEHWTRVE